MLAKKLLLVGAGHAHIGLLRRLTAKPLDNVKVTLISEQPQALYSGMLPGWMASHYGLDEISIDISELCKQAGVNLLRSAISAVDANAQQVTSAQNEQLEYDVLSLNTGADTDLTWLKSNSLEGKALEAPDLNARNLRSRNSKSDAKVIPVRPLSDFVQQWQQIIQEAKQATHYNLAVVGAGAAATELVLAAQYALQRTNSNHQAYLVCGDTLLSGFSQGFRKKVIKQLYRHNIKVIYERAIGYSAAHLHTSAQSLTMNAVIAATGVTGSAWANHTDLRTIDDGFIAVNEVQQSVSHPNVFAVGDVATRVDQPMAHSGVHAVFGGVVEGNNLLAYLDDQPLKKYKPKNRTLYLLSCGDKYAIGSWGRYHIQGRWVWQLKRYIDKRFVDSMHR